MTLTRPLAPTSYTTPYYSPLPVILIKLYISTILPSALKADLNSKMSHLTLTRPSKSIELRYSSVPQDHSIRLTSLNNLALRLQYRFQKNGVPSDFDEAIELRRAALFLLSSESPGPSSLIRVTLHIFTQQGVPSVLGMVATLRRTEIFLPGLNVG